MALLAGILQILVFLLLSRVSHIAYWNVRRAFFIHPLLLDLVIALVFVLLFYFVSSVWTLIIVTGVAVGIIRGDQDSGSGGSSGSRGLS